MIGSDAIAEFLKAQGIAIKDVKLEHAPGGMGDIALPAFQFSKDLRKPPQEISLMLEKAFIPGHILVKAKAAGPYLNFSISRRYAAEQVTRKADQAVGLSGTCMVEFASPNTNKPLHLGHARNIAIGLSVSRLIEYSGRRAIRACLVNDRGIHICKSMLAYQLWGQGRMPDKKSDHFVGDWYVMYSQKEKEDPTLALKAQEMLQRWEANDIEVRKLWALMNSWAVNGFEETYGRLGVKFDKVYLESEIYDKGKSIIEQGRKDGAFIERDGAIIAGLGSLPEKVVMRKDGTSLYITQDIYLAMQKFIDYPLDMSLYVVGNEQNLHFQQLFAILGKLNFEHASKCRHLSYGMVNLPSGKMKSREGTVVDADDLLDELVNLALMEIRKRHELDEKEAMRRAGIIALGSLKFYLLKHDLAKDMTFDPQASIAFEGETGPYVMYTYARIASIMRKNGAALPDQIDFSAITDEDHRLVLEISRFNEAAAEASAGLRPFIICHNLLKLCQAVNEYYHKVPVLKAESGLVHPRLAILFRAMEIIRKGLALLDIETLEEM